MLMDCGGKNMTQKQQSRKIISVQQRFKPGHLLWGNSTNNQSTVLWRLQHHLVVHIRKFTMLWWTCVYLETHQYSVYRRRQQRSEKTKLPNKSHLGTAGNSADGKANRRSPADISHPVTMSLQLLVLLPLAILLSGSEVRHDGMSEIITTSFCFSMPPVLILMLWCCHMSWKIFEKQSWWYGVVVKELDF